MLCQSAHKRCLQTSSDPQTAKALPEEERSALPGTVPYLLAVLMPWCVHEAVVVEESQLLADQAVHDVRPGILPLQQASQGAVQVGPQVWGPVVSVERQLEREEGEEDLRTLRESLHGGTGCPRCAGGTCCSCSQFWMTRLEQGEWQQLNYSPLLTATAVVVAVLALAVQEPSLMWALL